jgi:LysR family transcriptional regulator, regulator for genes of the gallate degradation pathway
MELRQLKHFLAVVDAGSLGDAARKLRMSQSALTRSIQLLERSMGAPLFVRSLHGMTPTAYGHTLEMRARVIISETERTRDEFKELLGAQRGKITVGAGPAFSEVLPLSIARFLASSPKVKIELLEGFVDPLFQALKAGHLDFVLMTLFPGQIDDALETEILLPNERAIIVASATNPLVQKRRVSAKQILPGPWLLSRRPDPFRYKLDELFLKAGVTPPEAIVECDSIHMMKNMLQKGEFLSLLSDVAVRREIDAGLLGIVRVPELTWTRDVGVVLRRGAPLAPAASKFLEAIRAVCAEFRSKDQMPVTVGR